MKGSQIHLALAHWKWSVVAEWLGHRALNQRVMDLNPGQGMAWYL
jgi:hypothetical protein